MLACLARSDDGCYGRVLYMGASGKVYLGASNTSIGSAAALNDGRWHLAVGQVGANGMQLWIDGVSAGTSTSVTGGGDGYIVYPQFGYSGKALNSGLADQPKTLSFTGYLQMLAHYGPISGAYLTDTQVRDLYLSALP